ncbi:spermidine synthase [Ewingella sp. S1.OA.A_B6]
MASIDEFLNRITFLTSGDIVAQEKDEYGNIVVTDSKKYRILRFDGINEQSKMLKSDACLPVHNYIKAMLMAAAFTSSNTALILGLGGGSLVRSLHALDSQLALDVVELRPRVLSIAREYFSLPVSDKINYYINDAGDYLNNLCTPCYDLIFSDLYSAFTMDPLQGTERFLRSCLNKIHEHGWLIMNYHELPRVDSPLYDALHRVFDEVFYCIVPSGNVVIYAAKKPHGCSLDERKSQANRLLLQLGSNVDYLSRKINVLRCL